MVTTKTNAVINFNYFCFNYNSDFIRKVWVNDESMQKHLTDKFAEAYDSSGPRGVMIKFFTELDQDNQRILVNWVNENYVGFPDLHVGDVSHSKEEKNVFVEKMENKWRERRKYINAEWGTQKYRELEMEFFISAMMATDMDIPSWTILMMGSREVVKKD